MAERRPGSVPDDGRPVGADVSGGVDTDGDARPDTVITDDGVDLVVLTDLDADGLADQVLRIGPDGVVRNGPDPADVAEPGDAVLDGMLGGADVGSEG